MYFLMHIAAYMTFSADFAEEFFKRVQHSYGCLHMHIVLCALFLNANRYTTEHSHICEYNFY